MNLEAIKDTKLSETHQLLYLEKGEIDVAVAVVAEHVGYEAEEERRVKDIPLLALGRQRSPSEMVRSYHIRVEGSLFVAALERFVDRTPSAIEAMPEINRKPYYRDRDVVERSRLASDAETLLQQLRKELGEVVMKSIVLPDSLPAPDSGLED
jgi:hypothetical protein